MRNLVHTKAHLVWNNTIGTTPCQTCKYGITLNDESYQMDSCAATSSIWCPVVQESLDDLITWLEHCLIEIEWIKKGDNSE